MRRHPAPSRCISERKYGISRTARFERVELLILSLSGHHRDPMKSDGPLHLDEDQVRKHLRMEELIPAMERALIDFSNGKVTQPVRSVITVDPRGGFFGMMPALTPEGLGI